MVTLSDVFTTEVELTSPWTVEDVSQAASIVPDNCITVGVNATIPWNNPQNLIAIDTENRIDLSLIHI